MTNDAYTIPSWQRDLHVATELASVLLVPAVFAAAKTTKGKHRKFLNTLGWSMLLIDGFLIYRWVTKPQTAPRQVTAAPSQQFAGLG